MPLACFGEVRLHRTAPVLAFLLAQTGPQRPARVLETTLGTVRRSISRSGTTHVPWITLGRIAGAHALALVLFR